VPVIKKVILSEDVKMKYFLDACKILGTSIGLSKILLKGGALWKTRQ
jgi:hypothetical protein